MDPQALITLARDLSQPHLSVPFTLDIGLPLPMTEHVVKFADGQVLWVAIYPLLLGQYALFKQVAYGEHGSLDRLGAVLLLELRVLPASPRRQLLLARLPAVH